VDWFGKKSLVEKQTLGGKCHFFHLPIILRHEKANNRFSTIRKPERRETEEHPENGPRKKEQGLPGLVAIFGKGVLGGKQTMQPSDPCVANPPAPLKGPPGAFPPTLAR